MAFVCGEKARGRVKLGGGGGVSDRGRGKIRKGRTEERVCKVDVVGMEMGE